MDKAKAEKLVEKHRDACYGLKDACRLKIEEYQKKYCDIMKETKSQLIEALTTPLGIIGATENKYMLALQSIAKNSCCDGCQEAKRVAEDALRDSGVPSIQFMDLPNNKLIQKTVSAMYRSSADKILDENIEADHLPDPKKVIPPKLSEAIAWATDHLENTGHDDDERFIYLKSLHDPANMQSKPAEPLHYGLLEAAKAVLDWWEGPECQLSEEIIDRLSEEIEAIEKETQGKDRA
jgi:hypothetical protein